MTQKRSGPATRPGEDFEWVNSWAEASGLNAAREFAAQPVKAAPAPAAPVAPIAPVPPVAAVAVATVRSPGTFAFAPDQLARDIADIEQARDAIIAAEATGVFVLPATRRRKPSTGVLRRHDAVPVLIGAMLALLVLIGYGAIASIAALGR
jgi:hypothetical protein